MEAQNYLISIPEIEEIILSNVDQINDLVNLVMVNKHFNCIIQKNPIYVDFCTLYRNINEFDIYDGVNVLDKQNIFFKACKYGFFFVVRHLLRKFSEKIDIRSNGNRAFLLCCMNGHLKIIKFLYSFAKNSGWNINIHINTDQPFHLSCINNHIKVGKWIYSLDPTNDFNLNFRNMWFFKKCCMFGTLEIVKFVYQLYQSHDFQIKSRQKNHAFVKACKYGNLDIVKFLYSLNKIDDIDDSENIDIHFDREKAFRYSCKYNHIEIAKFLYSIDNSINIKAIKNYVFRKCCTHNYLEMATWLSTLSVVNKFTIIDNKIVKCVV